MHEAGHGLLDAYTSYTKGDIQTALAEGVSILKTLTRTEQAREESRKTRTSPADVIQISGCKNYQTSADAVEAVLPHPNPTTLQNIKLTGICRGGRQGR